MQVSNTACLEKFKQLRSEGYNSEQAMYKVVYNFAKLDYDNDEDDICNLQAFLSINDNTN